VASGELTNLPMIAEMARDRKPMLLSTGMSPYSEIDAAVEVTQKAGAPYCIFQCTTQYPSPPEAIGLNVLDELRARYACAVGLSDHSGTIYPALAAVAAHEAEVLEVHLTLSRDMFGPDVVASVTPAELKEICDGVRFIERMRAAPADKNKTGESMAAMRGIFLKSVVALCDLPAGAELTRANIGLKKPGGGIAPDRFQSLLGRTLKRAVARDQQISIEDLA
jgi:N-acetylneuraminate synthase